MADIHTVFRKERLKNRALFIDLLSLYKKESHRTPLEDFNTESFAGILRLCPDVKELFLYDFLKLPIDDYQIQTQLKKDLVGELNCIIDFVLVGKENICFIENKVESTEGYEQLSRYGKVLDKYYPNLTRHLFYCTKYTEPKNQDKKYDRYNFKQFKWYDIAKRVILPFVQENALINDYYTFLEKYNMAQDNTLKAENLLTMENLQKTIDIIEFHLNNSEESFTSRFGIDGRNKNHNWEQIRGDGRFAYYKKNIVEGSRGSEILYAINLPELSLSAQIYMGKGSKPFAEFNKLSIDENSSIEKIEGEYGTQYVITKNIAEYVNNPESDKLIKDWFEDAFDKLLKLMKDNPQMTWLLPQK